MKVGRYRARLEQVDATAVFVVHDTPAAVRRVLLAGIGTPFPLAVDQDRSTYRSWGLHRASWARIWLDPKVYTQYARLLVRGERVRGRGRDVLQLGGDFVVDAAGRVRYSRPQVRDDRPSVLALVRAVEDARVAPEERDHPGGG